MSTEAPMNSRGVAGGHDHVVVLLPPESREKMTPQQAVDFAVWLVAVAGAFYPSREDFDAKMKAVLST